MTRHTYHLNTPAQIRSFRLLTLAQMVHLESIGLSMTTTSAKRQALEMLDGIEPKRNDVTAAELIDGLRKAAADQGGPL